jgi:hypothetical protein
MGYSVFKDHRRQDVFYWGASCASVTSVKDNDTSAAPVLKINSKSRLFTLQGTKDIPPSFLILITV